MINRIDWISRTLGVLDALAHEAQCHFIGLGDVVFGILVFGLHGILLYIDDTRC